MPSMKSNFPLVAILAFVLLLAHTATAEFTAQDSQTTADLRGIHAVNDSIAWASGTQGTVLRTVDGGQHWEKCATPPDADKLDFRGIWAWDSKTAEIMSAGPGELSRLFKTTDGCQHWTELTRNDEKDGFWDSFAYQTRSFGAGYLSTGTLVGDPVNGRFSTMSMFLSYGWFNSKDSCPARPDEAAFAASNSSLFVFGTQRYIFVTGGKGGPRALLSPLLVSNDRSKGCAAVDLPLAKGEPSAGAFSVYFRDRKHGVVVGGDYKKPNESSGTAAWTSDGGLHWTAASKLPHGYRSAVSWDPKSKSWIAVGTNGADISTDDGKTWQPLDNENWNAVSLPFAVGPKGRIGKFSSGTISSSATR
jgi:photosystem II stability/assembly factor-like uncharacterized protein